MKIEVSRDYAVPVDKLFNAWVQDEQLKHWWKPGNNSLVKAETDLREGGGFRYEFENNSGESVLVISGTYKEVEQEKKLVYTWEWNVPQKEVQNNAFLLKVNFTAVNKESSIRIIQENFDDHESIHPHEHGWNDALDALEKYLAK